MEIPTKPWNTPVPLQKDSGFTMDFSMEIVDDVEGMVDEMMRLGDLGYFKDALEISASLVQYSDTFAIAAERMRLLLIQGDFDTLLSMCEDLDQKDLTGLQRNIVSTLHRIACFKVGRVQEPSEFLKDEMILTDLSNRLKNVLASRKGEIDGEELMDAALSLHVLQMSLLHEGLDPLRLANYFSMIARLGSITGDLVYKRQFWSAAIILALLCDFEVMHHVPGEPDWEFLASVILDVCLLITNDWRTAESHHTDLAGYTSLTQTICQHLGVWLARFGSILRPSPEFSSLTQSLSNLRSIMSIREMKETCGPRAYVRWKLEELSKDFEEWTRVLGELEDHPDLDIWRTMATVNGDLRVLREMEALAERFEQDGLAARALDFNDKTPRNKEGSTTWVRPVPETESESIQAEKIRLMDKIEILQQLLQGCRQALARKWLILAEQESHKMGEEDTNVSDGIRILIDLKEKYAGRILQTQQMIKDLEIKRLKIEKRDSERQQALQTAQKATADEGSSGTGAKGKTNIRLKKWLPWSGPAETASSRRNAFRTAPCAWE